MSIKNLHSSRAIIVSVVLFWIICLTYFACKPDEKHKLDNPISSAESVIKTRDTFLGEQNCVECHQEQFKDWEN